MIGMYVMGSSTLTASQRRRAREREALRTRILDAARVLFVQDGYEAVTLAKIASAIEYSPGTIYTHFEDKRALVMAIIREDWAALSREVSACRTGSNPIEQLWRMMHRVVAWGTAHPNHILLMISHAPEWSAYQEELRAIYESEAMDDPFQILGFSTLELFKQGVVREAFQNPGLVATTLNAAAIGLVIQEISVLPEERKMMSAEGLSLEERVDGMLHALLNGGMLRPEWREQFPESN